MGNFFFDILQEEKWLQHANLVDKSYQLGTASNSYGYFVVNERHRLHNCKLYNCGPARLTHMEDVLSTKEQSSSRKMKKKLLFAGQEHLSVMILS